MYSLHPAISLLYTFYHPSSPIPHCPHCVSVSPALHLSINQRPAGNGRHGRFDLILMFSWFLCDIVLNVALGNNRRAETLTFAGLTCCIHRQRSERGWRLSRDPGAGGVSGMSGVVIKWFKYELTTSGVGGLIQHYSWPRLHADLDTADLLHPWPTLPLTYFFLTSPPLLGSDI